MPALLEASAGQGLRFHLGVSLDPAAPVAVRAEVDKLLAEVAPTLKASGPTSES